MLDLATGGELLSVIEHHKARALAAGLGPQVSEWSIGRSAGQSVNDQLDLPLNERRRPWHAQRACPWAVGRFYLGEVCLALEYLHGEGVVHRDLKPQNVLISQHGHVKVSERAKRELAACRFVSVSGEDDALPL